MDRKPRLPSLDLLRGFEAAARHLSFTRAAEELFLTQSAVSRQIKALEEEIGRELFRRRNRRLELTDAGSTLFGAAAHMFGQLDQAMTKIRGEDAARTLTVSATVSFASLWLVPRLPAFRRGHPEVDVRISATNEMVDLERDRIDLAIRFCEPKRAPPGAVKLSAEEVFPVCSPRLARDRKRPLREPADLARHVLLHLDDTVGRWPWLNWPQWLEALGLEGLRPAGSVRFSHYDQLIRAAIDGEGGARRMNVESRNMRAFDWYFDFISPFSYLQGERIAGGSAEFAVNAKPILFAGLLEHWGHKGPAEIPAKRTFTYRHVQWLAERDGVALRFPPRHPFNPIRVLRLAVALNADLGAIRAIFGYIWGEGGAVDTPEGWAELTRRLGVDDAQARIADPEVKARLRRNGEEAIAAGVFGVPTLALDGMLFWGYDATAMATDYLRDPGRFRSGELGRVAELPVGVSRV